MTESDSTCNWIQGDASMIEASRLEIERTIAATRIALGRRDS